MLDLTEVKNYLKVDYANEDEYLKLLIEGAEYFIEGLVKDFDSKKKNTKFIAKCKLVMLVIIADCYETRSLVTDKQEKIKITMSSIIKQLQYGSYI